MAEKTNLASQPVNIYKGAGRYVFYVDVKPRAFKEGKDPALSYGKTSVVAFNIFDSESRTGVVAYLEPGDPAYIMEKVKLHMKEEKLELPDATCYKTLCVFGPYQGRTVAEFVLNAPHDEVVAEYNRLQNTLEKYPNNKKIINAIAEANKLKKENSLVSVVPIRDTIISELKTPDNKKLDKNGNTECRQVEIKYDSSAREPYQVKISNFMAPPADGLVGAVVSKATDKKELLMSFTEKDFFYVMDETLHAKEMYSKATEGQRIRYANANTWHPEEQN